jgi:hypothetical protein
MIEATHTHKPTGNKLQFVEWQGSNELLMKDHNGLILSYTEAEVTPIFTKKWFVEIFTRNKHSQKYSRLDIIEPGHETKEEAEQAAKDMDKEQEKDNTLLMDQYTERMRAFVMDETTEDTEPHLFQYKYKHSVRQYEYSPFHGFKPIYEGEEEAQLM